MRFIKLLIVSLYCKLSYCLAKLLFKATWLMIQGLQVSAMQAGGGTRNGAIVINEGAAAAPSAAEAGLSSAERRSLQADSDYARQLQAKMDAQESRAANKYDL